MASVNPAPCKPEDVYAELRKLDIDVRKNGSYTTAIQGVVVIIIVALMGWVATEIQALGKSMLNVEGSVSAIQLKLEAQNQIQRLEVDQIRTTLEAKQEVVTRAIDNHRQWLDQIWPRLRALQNNQSIMRDKIKTLHKDQEVEIELQTPENF